MASSRGRKEKRDGVVERKERWRRGERSDSGESERETVSRASSRAITIREVDFAGAIARERGRINFSSFFFCFLFLCNTSGSG